MSTIIRPEITKNKYYFVPKHRYYELKHFCLQYSLWTKTVSEIDGYKNNIEIEKIPGVDFWKSSVETAVELRENLIRKIDLVKDCAFAVDDTLGKWILKGVTEGLSYTTLSAMYNIPCSQDTYYDRFRKFFWLLSRERD